METSPPGVSVYEVVLDLKQWEGRLTSEVPGFPEALVALLPATPRRKGTAGQTEDFHQALFEGTHFGQVVEHVLLELIHLAYPDQPAYSGWTKALGEGRHLIHYGAPGFLSGRLAAILAVDIVTRLQQGHTLDLDGYVQQLKNPMEYFSRQRSRAGTPSAPPLLDLSDETGSAGHRAGHDPPPPLSDWQRDNLVRTLTRIEDRLPEIHRRWQDALFTFGGDFARGIVDKIELINPDQFRSCFVRGDFTGCFRGVSNIGQMLRSQRIPLSFVTHSAWLYKNFMQLVILESFAGDPEAQTATTWDFDDFYQNIFHAIVEGYGRPPEKPSAPGKLAVCGFRARHVQRGTVLVVDDDQMARRVACDILEYRGFGTLSARNGLEAMGVLAEAGDRVGVVLLDVVMHGMSGQAVCRRIRDSYPSVRVILCSGYPLDKAAKECLDEHEVSYLRKPFRSRDLLQLVDDLLDLGVTGNGGWEPPGPEPQPVDLPPPSG
jgi:CheY-like chemotaxis protein